MSEEHKALGYRPPPGSLASAAQSAVAAKKASPPASPPLNGGGLSGSSSTTTSTTANGKGRKNSNGGGAAEGNTLPIEMLKSAARLDAERFEAERKKKAEVVGDVLGEGMIAGVPLDRIGEGASVRFSCFRFFFGSLNVPVTMMITSRSPRSHVCRT
jgi:hypothetical protein